MDVKYGFVRHYVVTDASVHDSQVFNQLRDIDGSKIWADSAYHSTDLEWTLAKIHEKGYRNQPLTAAQKVRAKVEHVFSQWVMCLGG